MATDAKSITNITPSSLPWKTRFLVKIISALMKATCHSDGTLNTRLLRLLDLQLPTIPNRLIYSVSSSNITISPTRNLWFRLFSPSVATTSLLPVLVFFHGGGFTMCTPASLPFDVVCRRFASTLSAHVISVNYRLAPEHRYPSQYDDGFDVLKFLDDNWEMVLPPNADLSRCFLAGDSAGANVAHHVAVESCRTETFRTLKLVGLVSIQPFFGGEERTESEKRLIGSFLVSMARTDWCWKVFLPEGSNRDHPAANVSGPNAVDISGMEFPDTVVFVGGFDPLQDWQRRYYDWLKKSGKRATLIEYPNMSHAFYVFPELSESSQLIMQVKDFVDKLSFK
ncbi:probable carboxylesterase 18 [Carica papaya]|uniref:probable carboxylesterase 18 n=1 Tax=Carica papaya TaxID=3649 RepID=UPI000B8C9FE9|nr:probable carboxylesterase 18 [Carica papaya]